MNTAMIKKKDEALINGHDSRAHAVLAPSSLKIFMSCNAALLPLETPIIEAPSVYADEGTRAHELMEKVLKAATPAEKGELLLQCADKEMRGYIKALSRLVDKIIEKIGRQNILKIIVEEKVRFSEHIFGTLDVGILYIRKGVKKAYILDLKYGQGVPVLAEENAQLKTYLVALLKTYDFDATEATIAIYQPRNFDETDKALDQWVIDEKGIKEWQTALTRFEKKALKVIEGEGTKPKEITGDHCMFCKRKPVCKSFMQLATVDGLVLIDKAAPLSTELIEVPEKKKGKLTFKPQDLSDAQLSQVVKNADLVRAFLKACEAHAAARYVSGKPIPGWKLVEGRSNRSWIDDEDRVIKGLRKLGIDEPYTKKIMGITEVEKQVGKDKIDSLTYKPPGKPKLVQLSDERPAIAISNPTEMLGELEVAADV